MQYYRQLIQQGYPPMAAAQYTKQYFPEFQDPILNPSLFISPNAASITQQSVQNPIGIGLPMNGLESSLNANLDGKSSRKSIFIASILILGLVGTGGYFLYDDPTEPDFYGEIYWVESEIAIIFEEDGASIGQPLVNGSCDIYQDEAVKHHSNLLFWGLHQKSNDICKHYFDSDKYSSEYKGDYYEVCGAFGLSCLEIYVFEHGIITKEQDYCAVHVSDINTPPSIYESFDENGHLDDDDYEKEVDFWLEDWYEVVDEIMDGDDAPSCFYDFMNDDYDFPSDTFIFMHSACSICSDMSNEGGDGLVYVRMLQSEDESLSKDLLSVSIIVDGGAPLTCQEFTSEWEDEYDKNAACTWFVSHGEEDIWEAGGWEDAMFISEGPNTNLCDGSGGGCTVEITLTKIGVGGEDDRVISQISAFAENIEHVDD